MDNVLDGLLDAFRRAGAALPDSRRGRNTRYAPADAASCALAVFFLQAPSFLEFQRRMQQATSRSNCHTLFGVQKIPCDNRIRDLLDGLDPAHFAELCPLCLGTVREQGALAAFERLGGRLLVALDGLQIHCSDAIRWRSALSAMSGPTSPSSTSIRCSRRRSSPTATTASCR